MNALYQLHIEQNAKMGIYNGKTVPAAYNSPEIEYKAIRENALMVDYSHMSIISIMGDDAWSLVNYLTSADISTIRDEQGMYTLLLNEDGSIWGDAYILCSDEGYYILSENLSAQDITAKLHAILDNADDLDIQEQPEIQSLDAQGWGAIQLEGPYSWELLSEVYGFDVIGLPFHEYMNIDDELMLFRCGKHGEFGYLLIGQQNELVNVWNQLLERGEKYQVKTGGLEYQQTVRVENPCWESSIYSTYSKNPVELQMQWAIQYDKDDFIGKSEVENLSNIGAERKLVGILPISKCTNITDNDQVLVNGVAVGSIVKSVYSPVLQSFIALALIDGEFAYSDIDGFDIQTQQGSVAAKTHNVPFIYNFSLLVNPTEHSYVDSSKQKSVL